MLRDPPSRDRGQLFRPPLRTPATSAASSSSRGTRLHSAHLSGCSSESATRPRLLTQNGAVVGAQAASVVRRPACLDRSLIPPCDGSSGHQRRGASLARRRSPRRSSSPCAIVRAGRQTCLIRLRTTGADRIAAPRDRLSFRVSSSTGRVGGAAPLCPASSPLDLPPTHQG
jgi:hypothetical protein